jgi:hypothetical protein
MVKIASAGTFLKHFGILHSDSGRGLLGGDRLPRAGRYRAVWPGRPLRRPERLRPLFEDARFRDIVTENEMKLFSFSSFKAWFGPIERREGLPG